MRKRRGFSQEELPEKSGLSLRTIQRIENGESNPTGESIKRISTALGVTPDYLIDWEIEEDNSYLVILSLSALSFLLFPLMGIIIPLIYWVSKKDKFKDVNELGRRILNFQITWTLMFYFYYMLMSGRNPFAGKNDFMSFDFRMFALYGFNIVVILVNSIRVYQNKKVFYIPAIRMLR